MAYTIGLDIGVHCLRVAVYDGGNHKLLKAQEVYLSEAGNLSAALRQVFSKKDFSKSHVWTAVNDRECLARDMRVPFSNEDQIRQTIRFSAEEVIPDDVEDYLLDYLSIETEGSETHLMIIAARRQAVSQKLQVLQEAHIDPEGLTFSGLALYHLGTAIANKRDDREPFLILDVGSSTADIIVGDEERLYFFRSILIHRDQETEALEGLRLKRLVTEVKRTLWSGGVDGHAEKVWLCGGITLVPQIEEKISKDLEIPVEILPVEEILKDNESSVKSLGAYAQSIGLALMGSSSKKPHIINFRREEFIRQPAILKIRWAAMCLLLILIGGVFWDGWIQLQKKRQLRGQHLGHLTWEVQQFVDFWGQENLPSEQMIHADPQWLLKEFEQRLGGVTESLTVEPDVLEAIRALSIHLTKFPGFKLKKLSVSTRGVSLVGSFSSKAELQAFEDDVAQNGQQFFRRVDTRGGGQIKEDGSIELTCSIPLKRESQF